jgi:hypothetical protein
LRPRVRASAVIRRSACSDCDAGSVSLPDVLHMDMATLPRLRLGSLKDVGKLRTPSRRLPSRCVSRRVVFHSRSRAVGSETCFASGHARPVSTLSGHCRPRRRTSHRGGYRAYMVRLGKAGDRAKALIALRARNRSTDRGGASRCGSGHETDLARLRQTHTGRGRTAQFVFLSPSGTPALGETFEDARMIAPIPPSSAR